jgi:hypothetical protein
MMWSPFGQRTESYSSMGAFSQPCGVVHRLGLDAENLTEIRCIQLFQ